ncbi:MAG: membrane protein insertion efficiency factor YidD [Rhizobiaceae bacterium]|nr:membrane protein insertion efficiency factor YidD [Rhizobiaceae bacterium]
MVDSSCQPVTTSDSKDSKKRHSRNWQGRWPKTPGRLVGIGLIRLYQLTLSGFIGNSCRHLPTCSEYGYEAIARHGLLRGGWLTLIRVGKCNPWGTSGHDPVPDSGKNSA